MLIENVSSLQHSHSDKEPAWDVEKHKKNSPNAMEICAGGNNNVI